MMLYEVYKPGSRDVKGFLSSGQLVAGSVRSLEVSAAEAQDIDNESEG